MSFATFFAILASVTFMVQGVPSCSENEDGFLAGVDCSTFYKCTDGVAYLYQCPSGLNFNLEQQLCDYPDKASCKDVIQPSCSTNEDAFFAGMDCSTYYKCTDGVAYLYQCASGLNFNLELQVCDWPENTLCKTN